MSRRSPDSAVAPSLHAIGLLIGLIALSIASAISGPIAEWSRTLATPRARLLLYTKILVLQWILFFYVWIGLRTSMRDLIDHSTSKAPRWLRYSAVAVAAAILWMLISAALSAALRPSAGDLRCLMAMLPKSNVERAL